MATQDFNQPQSDAQTEPTLKELLYQMIELMERHVSDAEESVDRDLYLPDQPTTNVREIVLDLNCGRVRYQLPSARPSLRAKSGLSPREQEIVDLVARGCCDKVVADQLGISRWTVGTHLRRIFAKLGVSSRAEMVAKALHGK